MKTGTTAPVGAKVTDATPANPAQGVTGRMKRDFAAWLEVQNGAVSLYQAYHAGRTAAIDASPVPPGWPDPLESPQSEAIRNGKLDDTELRNLFDAMERELRLHRERAAIGAGGQAVVFVSEGQLAALPADPPEGGAAYLPVRRSAKGKFQLALYAHPSPSLPLRDEVERVLKPFAKIAAEYADEEDDEFQIWKDFDVLGATLPLHIFRAASALLSRLRAEGGRNGQA
jgi:hypothetical protein